MDSEATWKATLQEVKRQALLHLKPPEPEGGAASSSGEDWVTVEPPEPQSPVWSERWPQQQWQVAFELLFCHMPAAAKSLRPHQDDLLFFVPAGGGGGGEEGGGGRRPPLLVRRRARQLPPELGVGGASAAGVNWRASVLLNLVLQTGYCLAVATCRHADLALLVEREGPSLPACSPAGGASSSSAAAAFSSASSVAGSSAPSQAADASSAAGAAGAAGSSIREVCQVVFASPSRVRVNLDASRPSSRQPEACYPDIAFAVEDFHHAFASVVLTQPDDCYCVLLYAEARDSWTVGGPSPGATASSSGAAAAGAGAAAGPAEDAVAGQLGALRLHEAGGGGQQAGSAPAAPAPDGAGTAVAQPGGQSGEAEEQGAQQLGASRTQPLPETAAPAAAGGPTPDSSSIPAGGGMPLVFSGFVSHKLLADAMAPSMGSGLLGGGRAERTSRVMMRGPGGLGGAEVAVTSKPAAAAGDSEEGSSSSEEESASERGPAGLPFIGRLAKGVVQAAKKAAAGRRAENAAAGSLHLRCALMTLTVPVDMLAASILEAL